MGEEAAKGWTAFKILVEGRSSNTKLAGSGCEVECLVVPPALYFNARNHHATSFHTVYNC